MLFALRTFNGKNFTSNHQLPYPPRLSEGSFVASGQILILALILLVVVMIISAAMFSKVTTFLHSGSQFIQWEQATVIADAGADYAVFKLNSTQGYSGNPAINLGIGAFKIDIQDVGSNKKITSTGCIPNCTNAKVKRVVKVEATSTSSSGADYGKFTDVYCPATDDCKISYYDVTNADLRMADCNNATCSSGEDRAVDDSTNDVGQFTGIYCLSSTDCKISYYAGIIGNSGEIKFADCSDDTTCGNHTLTSIDSTTDIFGSSSVYCPSTTDCKISYSKSTVIEVKFADCNDATCANKILSTVDPDDAGPASIYCPAADDCKISIYDGNVAIDLRFADCTNATCSAPTVTVVDGAGGDRVGPSNSIYCPAASDCKISYYDATNGNLKFVDCNDVDCHVAGGSPSSKAVITTVDTGGASQLCTSGSCVGQFTSIYCLSSTDCKISYYDVSNGDLKFVDCNNATCSSNTSITVDSTGDVGQFTGIYCISTSDCKISYYDVTNGDLKFRDCDNETCSLGTTITVNSTTQPSGTDWQIRRGTYKITVN